MGKDFETVGRGRRDRGSSDNIGRAVQDVEEGEVLDIIKGGPDELWWWGARRGSNRRGGTEGVGIGTWVIPSVEVWIENLKDGGGGISDVLLIDVIKGQPGHDRDLGKGRGGDDSGLRSIKRHLILN